jgi:hypothetical protein
MSTSDGPLDGTVHSTTRTFTSLDEMPEHLKAEAEQLMAQAGHTGAGEVGSHKQVFRFSDSKGNEQVYHSLEEMPPEVREQFERIRRQTKS